MRRAPARSLPAGRAGPALPGPAPGPAVPGTPPEPAPRDGLKVKTAKAANPKAVPATGPVHACLCNLMAPPLLAPPQLVVVRSLVGGGQGPRSTGGPWQHR